MEGVKCACMGEREGVCIWKGLGGEGGCVYGRGGVCMHGESGVCIWKGWRVHAWGEGGCVYGRGRVCMDEERMRVWKVLSVHALGEGGRVHMEVVECACMGRGRACAHGRGGVCVHE